MPNSKYHPNTQLVELSRKRNLAGIAQALHGIKTIMILGSNFPLHQLLLRVDLTHTKVDHLVNWSNLSQPHDGLIILPVIPYLPHKPAAETHKMYYNLYSLIRCF